MNPDYQGLFIQIAYILSDYTGRANQVFKLIIFIRVSILLPHSYTSKLQFVCRLAPIVLRTGASLVCV